MLFIDNKDSVFSSTGDRLLLRLLMYNCTLCKSSLISVCALIGGLCR